MRATPARSAAQARRLAPRMTLNRTAAFVMILFLGCESDLSGVGKWLVRFDGYGPVRIGMMPAEASKNIMYEIRK